MTHPVPPGNVDLSRTSANDIELALTVLALCGGNRSRAKEILQVRGSRMSIKKIGVIAAQYQDRYEERRQDFAPQIEAVLANDLLDNAKASAAAVRRLIIAAMEQLDSGQIVDPARTARELSQVLTQSVDKRLALQGRPTQVVEHRDIAQIIKALEGMKVVTVIDAEVDE